MTLQRRVFFSFAGLVLVIVLAVTAISLALSMRAATTELSKHLDDALVAYGHHEAQRGELLVTQARAMASAPHLKATLLIPEVDRETISYSVTALRDIADTDVLALLDPMGKLVADAGRASITTADMSAPFRERALSGESFAALLVHAGEAHHVAAAPIESGGRLLGVLLLGSRLDTPAALRMSAEVTGANVALLVDGRLSPGNSPMRNLPQDVGESQRTGQTQSGNRSYVFRERVLLAGRLHVLLYLDMDDIDSSIVALQRWLLALALVAVVAGLFVARALAGRILVPLRDLTRAAEALGSGDLDARVSLAGNDEVATLAGTFNAMAEQLSTHRQALVESRDAAEAASREKSAFLARMSHEIRTPLNGMLGVAEVMRLDTRLASAHRDYLGMLHTSGTNLLRIVNDVLDVAKIESGHLQLELSSFDLLELVDGCLDLYEPQAERCGVELLGDVAPDLPRRLIGDAPRLRQILCNLLSNALKFTPSGCVVVRVSASAEHAGRHRVRLVVRDTGVGIRPEMQERIFEPFQQEDESTTRRFGGTGLGLAIVKQLVELMGGSIEVTSEMGGGAEFFVTLELERDPAMAVTERIDALANAGIHLVTRGSDYAGVITRQLCHEGARVVVHASLDEAVVACGSELRGAKTALVLDAASCGESFAPGPPDVLAQVQCPVVVVAATGQEESTAHLSLGWVRQRANVNALASRLRELLGAPVPALPASTAHELAVQGDDALARSLAGMRVLLVEDSIVNQAVAEGMLTFLGCSIEIAQDGAEAVETVFRWHFDAVLMDCQMPRMDGLQATREIRRIEAERQLRRVPIVALTANVYREDQERCRAAGMDDYVGKPFTLQELSAALSAAGQVRH